MRSKVTTNCSSNVLQSFFWAELGSFVNLILWSWEGSKREVNLPLSLSKETFEFLRRVSSPDSAQLPSPPRSFSRGLSPAETPSGKKKRLTTFFFHLKGLYFDPSGLTSSRLWNHGTCWRYAAASACFACCSLTRSLVLPQPPPPPCSFEQAAAAAHGQPGA